MTALKDSVFIVTGAASGIGQATAWLAARRGALVLATDVDAAGLARTVDVIGQDGGRAEAALLNVADAGQIEAFARHVARTCAGRRLILFNNAGVGLGSGTFDRTSLEDFEWLLSINLWGVVRLTKAFLPLMRAQNAGHIVNVSSVFGLFGAPENSAYSTAKFAVRGFTEVLRNELHGTGIRVSTVFPGGVKTNIAASSRLGGGHTEAQREYVKKAFERSALTTPDQAARTIVRGIERNQARILVGPDARVFDWLTRLLPVASALLLLPLVRRSFAAPPPAAAPAPGTAAAAAAAPNEDGTPALTTQQTK